MVTLLARVLLLLEHMHVWIQIQCTQALRDEQLLILMQITGNDSFTIPHMPLFPILFTDEFRQPGYTVGPTACGYAGKHGSV